MTPEIRQGQRIACLLVPDAVTAAALRAHPELAGRPLAVATGSEGRCEVVAASREASAHGIRSGQTLAYARSACAELVVQVASPALARTLRASLLDIALSMSPRADLAPRAAPPFEIEAAVFLDAEGVTPLFDSERAFASALSARAEALGLPGTVAIAGSRFTSHVAARRLTTSPTEAAIQVLPGGADATFLSAQPIDLLAPDDALAARLTRFGVHFVHDLLALPRRGLARRLGPEALRLVARACGEEDEPPLPQPVSKRCEESVDLDYAIDRAEALLFVLRGMLSRLFERLALRSLAARDVDLELHLEGRRRDVRRIGVAAPTRELRVWLRLLALELEAHAPEAAVEAIVLGSEGHPERPGQLDLFLPRGPSPGELDRALAELEALCGTGQVGSPRVADTHRPDAFDIAPFRPSHTTRAAKAVPGPSVSGERVGEGAPDSYGTKTAGAASDACDDPRPPAVRALRPAVPAQVRVEAGTPVAIRSAVTSGRIVNASGPWRTTGRWWSEDARYALDHFDVQVSDGAVARLCFDWIEQRWSVDALYD